MNSAAPALLGRSIPPKRTRANVQQSRNGCYTCRARRVKCDEVKPFCRRCHQTGRTCEGYRAKTAVQSNGIVCNDVRKSQRIVVSPKAISVTSFLSDSVTSRFAPLGLSLLSSTMYEDQQTASSIVWTKLLPRLCRSSRIVYTATAALGAAYEAYATSPNFQGRSYLSASFPYDIALDLLNREILISYNGSSVALFMATVILAGVEALQRNLTNALMHLKGTFKIYKECIGNFERVPQFVNDGALSNEERLALEVLVLQLDLQCVTYKVSLQLELVPSNSHFQEPSWKITPVETELEIVSLLHACYAFCYVATTFKYLPGSHIPLDVTKQQSYYISLLHQYLSRTADLPQLATLRTQCLSAAIYLSSILSPYETVFDSMHHYFRQIVEAASEILSNETVHGTTPQMTFRYREISSLSQPLFLTAMKCRDARIRRKAIELLALTGREGPWDSNILVAVARSAVAIEEGYRENEVQDKLSSTSCVHESARLHGCGMGHISSDTGSPVDGMIPQNESGNEDRKDDRIVKFRFRRCVDIERLMTAFGQDDRVSEDDAQYWEVWDERIVL